MTERLKLKELVKNAKRQIGLTCQKLLSLTLPAAKY